MTWKFILYLAAGLGGLGFGFCPKAHSETVTISRRLVRFDGQPAAGATVRVLGDYGNFNARTDFEVTADTNGVFTVDVTQTDALWVGHLIVQAEGCASLCEAGVTGRPKSAPETPLRRLRALYHFKGRTMGALGKPVAGARVSLILAQLPSENEIPFNSLTTWPIRTPELVAHSNAEGIWTMPGIDFIAQDHFVPATLVFETTADRPRRMAKAVLQADPAADAGPQKNVPLDFTLAPPIRVTGRVVNAVDGKPVAGALCLRAEIFTSLTNSSALTETTGRFELEIPGPVRNLWFQLYRTGFATTTIQTAMRDQATSDWGDTRELTIRVRPLVPVSGRLLDEQGQPLDESAKLAASYDEKINETWELTCNHEGSDSTVGVDGLFNAKLPAGRAIMDLIVAPQSMGSGWGMGMSPLHYRLQEAVNIPPDGITNWQLRATRTKL